MSIEIAKVFNFLQGNTILHRMDPRAKGVIVFSFSILGLLFQSILPLACLLLLALPLLWMGHMATDFFKSLRGLTFLFFFIFIFDTLLIPTNGFNSAVVASFRIIVLMLVFSIYFQTTLPEDLMQSMIAMKLSYPTAFSLSLAFRFIPTIASETDIIFEAQKSRGHRIEEGGVVQQLRNLIPLIIPLILNSIRRATMWPKHWNRVDLVQKKPIHSIILYILIRKMPSLSF